MNKKVIFFYRPCAGTKAVACTGVFRGKNSQICRIAALQAHAPLLLRKKKEGGEGGEGEIRKKPFLTCNPANLHEGHNAMQQTKPRPIAQNTGDPNARLNLY
jgi:hypothetical protein